MTEWRWKKAVLRLGKGAGLFFLFRLVKSYCYNILWLRDDDGLKEVTIFSDAQLVVIYGEAGCQSSLCVSEIAEFVQLKMQMSRLICSVWRVVTRHLCRINRTVECDSSLI